jgi:hypothetical protein
MEVWIPTIPRMEFSGVQGKGLKNLKRRSIPERNSLMVIPRVGGAVAGIHRFLGLSHGEMGLRIPFPAYRARIDRSMALRHPVNP